MLRLRIDNCLDGKALPCFCGQCQRLFAAGVARFGLGHTQAHLRSCLLYTSILEVRGLTKTYGGEKKPGAKQPTPTLDVLKGIDIDIYRGDVVCLIGPSGCGKSTFLRCLNRLEIPSSGSIKFEGTEVDEAHIDGVRQKMGMVFQLSLIHIFSVQSGGRCGG